MKNMSFGMNAFSSLIMNMQILNISSTKLRIRDEMGTIVSLSELAHGFLKLNAELVTHTSVSS